MPRFHVFRSDPMEFRSSQLWLGILALGATFLTLVAEDRAIQRVDSPPLFLCSDVLERDLETDQSDHDDIGFALAPMACAGSRPVFVYYCQHYSPTHTSSHSPGDNLSRAPPVHTA